MTVRKIEQRPGAPRLGRAKSGRRADVISRITVYPGVGDEARNPQVMVETPPFDVELSLSCAAGVELVKGILQNLPDVYLAADDELQAIFKDKVAAANADARAVVEAVRERNPGSV